MSDIEMTSSPQPGFAAAFIALGQDILSRLPQKPETHKEAKLTNAS